LASIPRIKPGIQGYYRVFNLNRAIGLGQFGGKLGFKVTRIFQFWQKSLLDRAKRSFGPFPSLIGFPVARFGIFPGIYLFINPGKFGFGGQKPGNFYHFFKGYFWIGL